MNDNTIKKQKTLQKSRNLKRLRDEYINRVFNIFTFLPFVAKPADQRLKYLQNKCSFMRGICTQKKWSDISIRGRENHVSP